MSDRRPEIIALLHEHLAPALAAALAQGTAEHYSQFEQGLMAAAVSEEFKARLASCHRFEDLACGGDLLGAKGGVNVKSIFAALSTLTDSGPPGHQAQIKHLLNHYKQVFPSVN